MNLVITDKEFGRIQAFVYEQAGISLPPTKKSMVANRLSRRLRHHGLGSLGDYLEFCSGPDAGGEQQMMLDLLTTNETSFFREPAHFDFLAQQVLPQLPGKARIWSAACSTGQEPYTLGMVMDETLGPDGWEILATDISTRVLEQARQGRYPVEQAERIPQPYRHAYCLKGVRSQDGFMLMKRGLRERVRFEHFNLNGDWGDFRERFHAILLRNVMIYFDPQTKRRLVERLAAHLEPGGYLIIGHSETLNGVSERFQLVRPSIYRLR